MKSINNAKIKTWSIIIGSAVLLLFFIFSHKFLDYSNNYAQLIFSERGVLMNATLAADDQWRFSPTLDVPEKLEKAILTFEDKRFYHHPGVDPIAVARALWLNVRYMRKVSGASTLTMQLARLGRKKAPRSIGEKLLEMLIALRLELRYSKKEILGLWAARAPYGSNVVGFEAASWRYFGRSPDQLSWAEASLLAVLPNSPALIFPGRNQSRLEKKRNSLLEKLYEETIIDSLTWQLALDEPLPDRFYSMPRALPHLAQHIERLEGKRSSNRYVVSIDPLLQKRLAHLAARYQQQYARQMVRNIAIIVAETRTGKVLGYIGNAGDTKTPGVQVDVIQSLRSTGSLLKPFLYAGALSEGFIAPDELIKDLPVNYSGYSPKNYSNEYFGAVPASEALSRSLNVPMVRLLRRFGVDRFHRRLKEIGMTSLNKSSTHYGLSLILGGADATLFNLTEMYAGLGRLLVEYPRLSGRYNEKNYHKLSFSSSKNDERVYDEPPLTAGAVWYTLEAMRKLERPVGEGRWQQFSSSRRLAWKTGTSYGFRDAWAIGLDPEYTVGVWVGNADGEARDGLVGVLKAGPVLFDAFRLLPAAETWFPVPWDDMKSTEICKLSGMPAGDYCSKTRQMHIPHRSLRTGKCRYCRPVMLSEDLKERYFVQCAPDNIVDTTWFVLPPGMEWFYQRRHSRYKPLPPLSGACRKTGQDHNPIAFVYPHSGAKLVIPYDLSGKQQEVVFQAVHRYANSILFWYLDDRFITKTSNYHQIGITPEKGWHTLLVEDTKGFRKTLRFKIEEKNATRRSVQK